MNTYNMMILNDTTNKILFKFNKQTITNYSYNFIVILLNININYNYITILIINSFNQVNCLVVYVMTFYDGFIK